MRQDAVRYLPMVTRYDPKGFEQRWASDWDARSLYAAPRLPGDKPKRFVMEMFPYPSGDLHMGHVENYSIADAMARYWRMKGFEVLHPMGFDSFGLPAENAAMKGNIHPSEWTKANIAKMRSSFLRLGLSYDWSREISSSEPDYYRWNQWIFLKFFERGLAYRKRSTVNWCPVDKTVLAKEQVSTGVCWRCGAVPEARELTQWYLRITDYADRLLEDMGGLDWSESLLSQQRHWIGRSRGAQVTFKVRKTDGTEVDLPIFTTRPDTLWGATFVVLAPEHPLALELVIGSDSEDEFRSFLEATKVKAEVARMADKESRRGMALPAVAINPVNGEEIPIWAADYVLIGYGTGAIMAVPAHDQRDFEFARANDLAVRVVIQPEDETLTADPLTEAYVGPGRMIASGQFDGTVIDPESKAGIDSVIDWLESEAKGEGTINLRLRDWLVSRQRYWGTPIPVIHCEECGTVPVPYEELPVLLPEAVDYGIGEDAVSPLASIPEFVDVKCPSCGRQAKRETDTLDTFFDSSWYFLRYLDPKDESQPFSHETVAAWGPVDQYVGGTEHAVMHLIYARFFTKVFQDMGMLDFPEPFLALFNQGNVTLDGREMSKSSGHLVEAAEVLDKLGADSARTFILFCSPPDADYDFPADGMDAIQRVAFGWLSRVWRVLNDVTPRPADGEIQRALHRTIKAVTEDFETFSFNTAIARLMELVNEFSKLGGPVPRDGAEAFLKLLAPIAPFITEELWHSYGNVDSIHLQRWPGFDQDLADQPRVVMVVQVDGKVRDRIEVAATITQDEMRTLALASEKIAGLLDGAEPSKVIVVPPKLVNLVR
ncbi:MAG TPA: leucine--tRNA ligase [Actinomycetota bacterium]|nr:leucine--tRNA ligase [Actinomycetota bacterium]